MFRSMHNSNKTALRLALDLDVPGISNITYKSVICSTNINTCTYLFYRNNELPEIYRDYFVINSTVHSHCTRQKSDLHISSVQNQ